MTKIPDTARRHHVNRASPIRRPALPRAQPIRNFAGVFGARPAAAARAPKAGKDDKNGKSKRESKNKKPSVPAPAAAVARGVNAGYRVIEEYVRQGQEFARSLWPGSAGGGGETRTSTSTGSGGAGTANAPMNMTERLIRSASDLAGLFSEFLQTFSLPGTLPAPGSTPIPDFGLGRSPSPASPPPPPAEAATTISIDVRSIRRAMVTANLRAHSSADRLQVHELRPHGTKPSSKAGARLTGVTATTVADHRVVIVIEVPDALPADTYSGLIVDADSNLPRGTLSIQVFAGAGRARTRKPARK